jgi:ribosomal protein S18 acetylase RimI-like enzyme
MAPSTDKGFGRSFAAAGEVYPMAEWSVRPYVDDDFPTVWALERSRDPGGYASAVTVRQAAVLWPGTLLVADEDGEVVGFTIGAPSSDPSIGWILRLKVREDCRRRGHATALLRGVLGRLRIRGVRTVRLTVSPENHAARGLYARFGFREEALLTGYFGPDEDRLVLALRL